MSLSKAEAIREIEKSFDIVIKKMPMFANVTIALRDSVLMIVRSIREG